MRGERSGTQKSSWRKTVVRKWLNIRSRSDDLQVDYTTKETAERRKSCSDKDKYIYVNGEASGWLAAGIPGALKQPQCFEPGVPASPEIQKLKMFVGTWNVGGKAPNGGLNLEDWLGTAAPADIYVLGFQEIVPLNAGNVLGAEDKGPAAKWLSLICQALNAGKRRDPGLSGNYPRATPPECDERAPQCGRLESHRHGRVSFSNVLSLNADEIEAQNQDCRSQLDLNGSHRHGGAGKYCLVASKQMVGIFLCVWISRDLYERITNIKVSSVGTGIMGYLGNKGSVSISLTLRKTTFCFVCTHLTSGEKGGDEIRRNSDVMEILKKTRFRPSPKLSGSPHAPQHILDHDKVIWLGDLNYRLALSNGNTHELLQNNDWEALLEQDQLLIEQKAGRVFNGWEEGRIYFAPTYKYVANSDRYNVELSKSREKKRIPAWCDRILWRGKGLKQLWYVRGESTFSDHRPVSSLFYAHIDVGSSTQNMTNSPSTYRAKKSYASNCYNSSARVEAEEELMRQQQQRQRPSLDRCPLPHLQSSRF